MNLFENKLGGSYVIFAAGTGLLPFIDLISFTLRYAAHKVSKDVYSCSDNILYPTEASDFEKIVGNDFQLHVFISFANLNTAFFLDVCEKLEKFDLKYNLNIFKLYIRISSVNRVKWDEYFMKEKLGSICKNINKTMIVGPIGFMDDVRRDLISSGIVKSENIFLV